MKRLAWLALGGAIIGWGLAGALGGCGSDETGVEDPDAGDFDSNGPGSSSGSSGSNPGDDSGGQTSDAGDAGSDAAPTGSNPGKVTCGAIECDSGGGGGGGSANAGGCCIPILDAGPTCRTEPNCPRASIDLRCDEKADCQEADQKCCLGLQGARCDDECGNNDRGPQLCKTDAECGDAGPCNVKTCATRQFRVCGTPMGCQ